MDTTAPDPMPPLTRWQWTWRNLVAVGTAALAGGPLLSEAWDQNRVLFWLDLCTGVTCLVLYQYRRRWPFPIVLVINVIGATASTAVGTVTLSLISLATRRRWREILPVTAVNIAGGLVFFRVQSTEGAWFSDLALTVITAGAAVAVGMYIGARRELVATLQDRAERAEREQALRVSQARSQERERIAREMHDVLAHRISLVAMHAGALAYRQDLTQRETTETAEIIQSNAHRALADLREILGLLRDDKTDGPPDRPQPTLRDLSALVDEERRAGAHVRVTSSVGDIDQVPDSVGRNAYRMIQESLTNARKHAPDTTVDVHLSGRAGDGLSLLVSNPLRVGTRAGATPRTAPAGDSTGSAVGAGGTSGTPLGAGLGLIGLTERAALAGGRLEHGVQDDGRFVVQAWLPWPA